MSLGPFPIRANTFSGFPPRFCLFFFLFFETGCLGTHNGTRAHSCRSLWDPRRELPQPLFSVINEYWPSVQVHINYATYVSLGRLLIWGLLTSGTDSHNGDHCGHDPSGAQRGLAHSEDGGGG